MLSVAVTLCIPGLANADPGAGPDTDGQADRGCRPANQRLQDLGAQIQTEEESVNKAVVDVETARDNAAAAQHRGHASQQARQGCQRRNHAAAQKRFDRFAVASYVNGPSDSYLTAASPDDVIATAAAGRPGRRFPAGDGRPATSPHRR